MLIVNPSNLLKLLLVVLCVVTVLIFTANQIGEDAAIAVGNYLYIPIQITLLITSIWAVRHFGLEGIHGLGWLAFLGFVISWFAGDMTWIILETVMYTEPYPSAADLFYLPGYSFLLIFAISYIIPFRDAISQKMIITSVIISVLLTGFSVSLIGVGGTSFADTLSLAYPIADGIILVPVLTGLLLFFKSKVDVLWSLMLFGMLATFVGDVTFAYMEHLGTYHTGNPMELAFYFSYILLTFGVIYHKKSMDTHTHHHN